MKMRFISRKRKNSKVKFYIVIFSFSFFCTLKLIIGDADIKEFLLSSLMDESTNKKGVLITRLIDNLTSPKNILYSSFNKTVSKNELSVFASIKEDDFNYDEAKSDYAPDPEPINEQIIEPLVYLYNTHQLEEYESATSEYTVKPNVMIASYLLREKLNNIGIPTLVETNDVKKYLNDNNLSYKMSYHATEYFARIAQKENPTIMYLFDIHRDSSKRVKTYTQIEGKDYARVLFIVGYEHTLEENNVGFAEKLNELMEKYYPGLSRGINYYTDPPVNGIYYSNLNGKSVLLEIGGVDNYLEEVNNTMEAFAFIFNKYLKGE